MAGIVLQINVSRGGVPKRAIFEGVVTAEGLQGDSWAHPSIHGGPRQAVLILCQESIERLKELGYPVFAGALGENLTVQGIPRATLRAGQRYRAGDAILELTKLRRPCATLDVYGAGIQKHLFDAQAKAGDPGSPLWAMGGFYCSVVRGGVIRPGDPFVLLEQVA
ncbi:MAG: MOSC domain-containing protein [Bryobacteraceae bacterium]|nr:MOSC domain-containing protein [Bryobacteraceae bacterium]